MRNTPIQLPVQNELRHAPEEQSEAPWLMRIIEPIVPYMAHGLHGAASVLSIAVAELPLASMTWAGSVKEPAGSDDGSG
jgi:hypothetical protein